MSNIERNFEDNPTLDDARSWLESVAEKRGFYQDEAPRQLRTALDQVTSVLGDEEEHSVAAVLERLGDITARWARKTQATPGTARAYRARAARLLRDFLRYQADPVKFKPSGKSVVEDAKASKARTAKKTNGSPHSSAAPPTEPTAPTESSASSDEIAEHIVDLRPGLRVKVQVPRRLSREEAIQYLMVVASHCPEVFSWLRSQAWQTTDVVKRGEAERE